MPALALSSGELAPEPYVLATMMPVASDVRGGAIDGVGRWLTEEAPEEVSSRILDFTAGMER